MVARSAPSRSGIAARGDPLGEAGVRAVGDADSNPDRHPVISASSASSSFRPTRAHISPQPPAASPQLELVPRRELQLIVRLGVGRAVSPYQRIEAKHRS
ncbi:MAG: hypothetical protein K0S86_2063 [Geminicoccaceae bacterium]|nr:hypothetical protein [Geminicoccaceae bacterium]